MVAHFKLLWNGWVTTRRMDHLSAPCVFGCQHGDDSAQHYAVCDILWKFLHTPLPEGAGIPLEYKPSSDGILLLPGGYRDEHYARIVAGVYGFYRLMEHRRHNPDCLIENTNIPILLSAKKALSRKGRNLFNSPYLTPPPEPHFRSTCPLSSH